MVTPEEPGAAANSIPRARTLPHQPPTYQQAQMRLRRSRRPRRRYLGPQYLGPQYLGPQYLGPQTAKVSASRGRSEPMQRNRHSRTQPIRTKLMELRKRYPPLRKR
jgi:hypothetical protein